MENLVPLILTAVINNYTFRSGNVGTLLIFDQKYPKDHPLAGQQIKKSVVGNSEYIAQSTKGWTYDPANDRVNEPVVTKEILEERKVSLAAKYGITSLSV